MLTLYDKDKRSFKIISIGEVYFLRRTLKTIKGTEIRVTLRKGADKLPTGKTTFDQSLFRPCCFAYEACQIRQKIKTTA